MKHKNTGITLIALVITIIVLLILAGVTINLTLGDNGIVKVVEQAARNYKNAEDRELTDLENFSNTVDKTTDELQYATLVSKAKPGDYVEYDGGNGYTGLWQVLYNDRTYGLQIISADIVNENNLFILGSDTDSGKAKSDYNDVINILNQECKKYVNKAYATSGRCVGSIPLSPDDKTTESVILQFTYNDTTESGCKVIDHNYKTDYYAMKDAVAQNENGIHDIDKTYWIASRYSESYPNDAYFRVRFINPDGTTNAGCLWYVHKNGSDNSDSRSHGLRPIITLITNIKTNGGDGSIDEPYKLVTK